MTKEEDFLKTKKLILGKSMNGYEIPYSYLCTLLSEFAEEQTKELKRVTKKASILEQDVFKLVATAESKEKDEMIDALIDELEGTTKTDYTFRLIEKARKLIFLKHRK